MKGKALISILLLAVLSVTCMRRASVEDGDGTTPFIGLTLVFPEYNVTKAQYVPASADENKVNNLIIWIFTDETQDDMPYHRAVIDPFVLGPEADEEDFPQAGGGARRYAIPVDWDFATTFPRPKLDVFVMANVETFGMTLEGLSAKKEWNDVYNMLFGSSDLFSPESKTSAVPVDADDKVLGLPMSGYASGLTISGQAPSLSVESVSLERAVSKVRFVVSQIESISSATELAEELILESIQLDGNLIPSEEYVFANKKGKAHVKKEYVSSPMLLEDFGVDFPIASSASPEDYMYANQSGVAYEQLITDAIQPGGDLTHCGTFYLRESDQPLTGVISYRVKKGEEISEVKTHSFNMNAADFARNHTWTVYAYYISERTLVLSVSVLPWDRGEYLIDFSQQSLMVTQKFYVLSESVQSITERRNDKGEVIKDHYDVYLKKDSPAQAYIYVATPEGGELLIFPVGDENDFVVTPKSQTINPHANGGRINIEILGTGSANKSITIGFAAYTMGGDVKIPGESECIDQVYHFIIPVQ